jgi:hypothetical protein
MKWEPIIMLIMSPVIAVAAYPIARMRINGYKHGEVIWFANKDYNRKYRRMFASAFLTGVAIVIVVNTLAFFGYIEMGKR